MKTITDLFINRILTNANHNYRTLYVAIDVHGTLTFPTKTTYLTGNTGRAGSNEEVFSRESPSSFYFYPNAINALLELQRNPCFQVKFIVWTSGKQDAIDEVFEKLKANGIKNVFINENPDFLGNEYADFSKKFCFDVLLDDKAGFEPESDWTKLYDFLRYTDWKKMMSKC